jgi:hypothetical protein
VPKEIHAILTGTLACFLSGRTKDLSAPLSKLAHTTKQEKKIDWPLNPRLVQKESRDAFIRLQHDTGLQTCQCLQIFFC